MNAECEVQCPTCGAPSGAVCETPSGRSTKMHASRKNRINALSNSTNSNSNK